MEMHLLPQLGTASIPHWLAPSQGASLHCEISTRFTAALGHFHPKTHEASRPPQVRCSSSNSHKRGEAALTLARTDPVVQQTTRME
jgi:hypothetical protein